jgi:hypothetical protein
LQTIARHGPQHAKDKSKSGPVHPKAVSFLQKFPAASVKEGILIAGFLKKDNKDHAKQAWIYHQCKQGDANTTPPTEPVVIGIQGGGCNSLIDLNG